MPDFIYVVDIAFEGLLYPQQEESHIMLYSKGLFRVWQNAKFPPTKRSYTSSLCERGTFEKDDAGECSSSISFKHKSFDDIPKPKGLPIIGSALDYTPIKGFQLKYIQDHWKKRHQEYGPIYKERPLPGGEYIVYCSSAEDNEIMFRNDGRTPVRDALLNVKHVREKLGVPLGLMNISGQEWYRIRSAVNPHMLTNQAVWKYIPSQFEVAQDLVKYIAENLGPNNEVANFDQLLNRWAFEMTGVFVFDTRLGILQRRTDDVAKEIIESSLKMFELVGETLYGLQLWNYFETKKIRDLREAQKKQLECTNYYFEKSISSGNKKFSEDEKTLIEKILCSPELTLGEKQMMTSDLLLAGIDTTSNASSFVLYCLTLNPAAQEKIRQEIFGVLKKGHISGKEIQGMKYINAFLKEVQRMFPFVTSHSRRASSDLLLSGYHIPKGTNILSTSNALHGRNPKYFDEPDSFIPERWLGERSHKNRFLMTGSFGVGARKCLGRKFALQEIYLLLFALLPQFRVEYHRKPIRVAFKLTSYPSEKPQFTFIPLKK